MGQQKPCHEKKAQFEIWQSCFYGPSTKPARDGVLQNHWDSSNPRNVEYAFATPCWNVCKLDPDNEFEKVSLHARRKNKIDENLAGAAAEKKEE
jgi:hypothetical protein